MDHKLGLRVEGYRPEVLKLAMRQVQKASSFQEASDDLRELADVPVSDTHLRRLTLRIGQEWQALQNAQTQALKDKHRRKGPPAPPRWPR